MIDLIKGLFIGLNDRLDKMLEHLAPITMNTGPGADFKATTILELYSLKEKISDIIDEGLIGLDEFAPNSLVQYSMINDEFIEIEKFRYIALSRYKREAEGYFERLIQKIWSEIGSFRKVPFISTISNSDAYYWAYPKYNMIALPQDEEKYLLCLPDLYHEIAHLIFQFEDGEYFVGDFITKIKENYTSNTTTPIDFGLMHEAINQWQSSWVEEFACDMIATYLVGPAYAWEHLKVCAIHSGDYNNTKLIFNNHPYNEARMRAIFKILELTGHSKEVVIIKKSWDHFLVIIQKIKPTFYDAILPDELIEILTENVFKGCKNIALISYAEQLAKSTLPVSKVINDAWDYVRRYPEGFSKWEKTQIQLL
jgi:hypothetical protein